MQRQWYVLLQQTPWKNLYLMRFYTRPVVTSKLVMTENTEIVFLKKPVKSQKLLLFSFNQKWLGYP